MNTKKELATFLTWFRNGTCFTFTWFVILRLITSWVGGIEKVSITHITETLFGTMGAVLIFCLVFTNLIIGKLGFTARLSLFMGLITAYEILCLYLMGIFTHICSYQTLLLALFVIPLYLISLGIYSIYRKKKGNLYTAALQKYQQERQTVNE